MHTITTFHTIVSNGAGIVTVDVSNGAYLLVQYYSRGLTLFQISLLMLKSVMKNVTPLRQCTRKLKKRAL